MGRGYVFGVLAPYAEGFREGLLAGGYTEGSAARLVHLMAHVSRWLDGRGLGVAQFGGEEIAAFVADRRAAGYVGWRSPQALAPMLAYLDGLGVRGERVSERGVRDWLLGRYEAYLADERGAAPASRRSYLGVARRFLDHVGSAAEEELWVLTAEAVMAFFRAECARRSPGSTSATTTGMRSFLRYLYLEGLISVPLSSAVPSGPAWSLAGLPRSVSAAQASDLLASCDRHRVEGRRDFAILKLLVRLGLRAGEVADLELDHLDWHHGELQVQGKSHRVERLPIPPDVGAAIVAWLRDGRCREGTSRAVFTRLRAPRGRLTAGSVGAVVRRACDRAGYPRIGPHRLRHTAGTELLRAGASLTEAGRVLRHRRLHTTAIYAKVDLAALSGLAQPWPGKRP
jgi:site-specific recombinase XerD